MADLQKALATQVRNIEARTGKTLAQLIALVKDSGLDKHSEIVKLLKSSLGLGHGDANTITHLAKQAGKPPESSAADPLDMLYVGPKAALRPIHDALPTRLKQFGAFETAPKQKYVSYRRKKQFAMIGPATNTQVEIGLNAKDLEPTERLQALPPGKRCNYGVRVNSVDEVDAELLAWLRHAFDASS
jgi:hypothetical protein